MLDPSDFWYPPKELAMASLLTKFGPAGALLTLAVAAAFSLFH